MAVRLFDRVRFTRDIKFGRTVYARKGETGMVSRFPRGYSDCDCWVRHDKRPHSFGCYEKDIEIIQEDPQ